MSDSENGAVAQWIGQVHEGDSLELLDELPAESVHAVVCDPPYGIAFMGRENEWDEFESPKVFQDWCEAWASKCLRVLKPGGHLLAFGGDRTFHRLQCGIEDAGFEIRPCNAYLHGVGFPKGLDVSQAIDKKLKRADEREVSGTRKTASGDRAFPESDGRGEVKASGSPSDQDGVYEYTEAATPEAAAFDGWKTAQKPAIEPITVARKPLEGTVAENVLEHGAGALAIDNCRIPIRNDPNKGGWPDEANQSERQTYGTFGDEEDGKRHSDEHPQGRYPPNVILSPESSHALDMQIGAVSGGDLRGECNGQRPGGFVDTGSDSGSGEPNSQVYADSGGPSRFFYTSKASSGERSLGDRVDNDFPTVKPISLMGWLTKLVTREDQIVLDPFIGSGTTALAAEIRGQPWIGFERDSESVELARDRLAALEPWLREDEPEIDMLESETDEKVREYEGQVGLGHFGEAVTDGGSE